MRMFSQVPLRTLYMLRNGLESQNRYYWLFEESSVGIYAGYKQALRDITDEIELKEKEENEKYN